MRNQLLSDFVVRSRPAGDDCLSLHSFHSLRPPFHDLYSYNDALPYVSRPTSPILPPSHISFKGNIHVTVLTLPQLNFPL